MTGGYRFSIPVQTAQVYFHSSVCNSLVPWGAGCNFEHFPITRCACVCLLCPCVCMVHMHVYAQPTEHQDWPWSRDYHSSPVSKKRMAPWWVDREVMVWCEFLISELVHRLLELIYMYCPPPSAMASIFSSLWQSKYSFIPLPPTLACTVTALWA